MKLFVFLVFLHTVNPQIYTAFNAESQKKVLHFSESPKASFITLYYFLSLSMQSAKPWDKHLQICAMLTWWGQKKSAVVARRHRTDQMLIAHIPVGRVAWRSAAFRAPLHLQGPDARAQSLRGSVLRSILQHCKLMIQQIPSVLLCPLLLLCLNPLLPSVSPTLWSPAALQKWETTEASAAPGPLRFSDTHRW